MATLTSKLTLQSSDLTSDALSLTTATTFTGSHTSGLAREELKSVSKTIRITCVDGDADVPAALTHQGQYIDITDNHGLKKRYVFIDGSNSTVATGTILASDTDIGSNTPANLGLLDIVGGIAIDVTDGMQQRDYIATLVLAINHANGHNGSITAGAIAAEADGPQSTTLTNPTSGESGLFEVAADDSTITVLLDNTKDTAATNSKKDHPIIISKSKYAAPSIHYIKNTSAYHDTNNIVYLYLDNHAGSDIMEIRGGQFAYFPGSNSADLRAYTSTSGTIVEHMAVGTES
jgi:hypothetical protein